MSCSLPPEISFYLDYLESGERRVSQEQMAMAKLVRRVFATEDIYVDAKQLSHYMGLARYFPFKELFPWEKFVVALWDCTYKADGTPRWKTMFTMLGRGSGKDGLIAFDAFASISPYNPMQHYDVDICANNEEQAMRPALDIIEVLESPAHEAKLNRFYYHTKEVIQGRRNKGCIRRFLFCEMTAQTGTGSGFLSPRQPKTLLKPS